MLRLALLIALLVPAAAASAARPDPTTPDSAFNIVILGDSLTTGYGVKRSEAYPALLQQRIREKGWPFEINVAAHASDTARQSLTRNKGLLKTPIDVLIVALGTNDGIRRLSVDDMKKSIETIVDRAYKANPRAKIFIIGIRMPAEWGAYSDRFHRVYPRIAWEFRTAYLQYLLDDVVGDLGLTLADRIHPNDRGHKVIADRVWEGLEPLLAKKLRYQTGEPAAPPPPPAE